MSAPSETGAGPARLFALALATCAMLASGGVGAATEIRIGGTGNALGTMRVLGDEFAKRYPEFKTTILPSVGSSGALKAVPKGALDIGLSARPPTEEERKLGIVSFEYARSALVFAVPSKLPVKAITFEQIVDIYSGKMANWPDGTQVRPVLRQLGDDTTTQVKAMSPAIAAALSAAEQRPGLPFATTDQEAAEKMETVPGAFGVTTLALIISEHRPLRPLTLNGVEATVGNGASGKYSHAKPCYLLTRADPSPAVKQFIAFMQSPAGREILIRNGNWIP